MSQHLAITFQAPESHQLLADLGQHIQKAECYILESNITKLGQEISGSLLVTGNWKAIGELETNLQTWQASTTQLIMKRTQDDNSETPLLSYEIDAITLNNPTIFHDLITFFTYQEISIRSVTSRSYTTQRTQTEMLNIIINIDLPADVYMSDLRERFIIYCDELNIDATFDLVRG